MARGRETFPRCLTPGDGRPHAGIRRSERPSEGRGPSRCVLGRDSCTRGKQWNGTERCPGFSYRTSPSYFVCVVGNSCVSGQGSRGSEGLEVFCNFSRVLAHRPPHISNGCRHFTPALCLTPCPVTSKDRDLRFLLLASSDSSLFLLRHFFWPRTQGPVPSPLGPTAREGPSPVLLDRLSSLTACCSVGLGGRLQASGPGGRASSASLNECRDWLLRSVAGASRWRPSVPRARERRWAAFREIHLVRVRISFLSIADTKAKVSKSQDSQNSPPEL